MNVKVTLKQDQMFDPKNNVNFKSNITNDITKEKQRIAEEERQTKLKALKEKYSDIFTIVDKVYNTPYGAKDAINELFEKLVPDEGKAEVVAGELVRAACKIGHRWSNDGDRCYSGYGIETCGNAINYICNFIPNVKDLVIDYAARDDMDDDSTYDDFVGKICGAVIEYIADEPEEAMLPADDMLSNKYSGDDWLKEIEPKQEFDVSTSDLDSDLTSYLERRSNRVGYDEDDAFSDMLDDFCSYANISRRHDVNEYARDGAAITVPYGDMDENDFHIWLDRWGSDKLDELVREYGDGDDIDMYIEDLITEKDLTDYLEKEGDRLDYTVDDAFSDMVDDFCSYADFDKNNVIRHKDGSVELIDCDVESYDYHKWVIEWCKNKLSELKETPSMHVSTKAIDEKLKEQRAAISSPSVNITITIAGAEPQVNKGNDGLTK